MPVGTPNAPSSPEPLQPTPQTAGRTAQLVDAKRLRNWGIAMMVAGTLLARFPLIAFFSADTVPSGNLGVIFLAGFAIGQKLLGLFLLAKGAHNVYKSRQLSAATVGETLVRDCRRPVLYVRSFNDDARSFDKVHRWMAWFSPGEVGRSAIRYEEAVCKILTYVGPVIAIGRPGEPLPELGAARAYTTDEDWQSWVLARHSECSMVLLQAGRSAGLLWEVERVFRRDTFKPTLLCFPPDKLGGPPPEDLFLSFRSLLKASDLPLPDRLGKSYCIWFPELDRCEFVPPGLRGFLPGTQNRLAPGFRGLSTVLEATFPGIRFKVKVLRKRSLVLGTVGLLYVATMIFLGSVLF